jgi:hypothetical protein
MITPPNETPAPSTEPKVETRPADADSLRRQTGSGGFISISSICGQVDHRPKRKGYWTRRGGLHLGR